MEKISCVIIEDDEISITVATALAEKTGMLRVMETFTSAENAVRWLADHEVELLFLDIEMPGMTGLDMLRSLPYKPEVIIMSAKPQYALEAFDLSVVDYLLKPIKDYHRFLAAVNKIIAKRKSSPIKPVGDEIFFLKVESLLLKIDVSSILFMEASGDYVKIHTPEKIHTIYSTLKRMEDKLDAKKFVRVHRSYIVNIGKVTNIDPSNLEINKKIIPISVTYKDDLLNKISVL